MKPPPQCHWDGERWLTPADEPCPKDHCAMRGSCPGHVQHDAGIVTCGRCIGRVRRHLSAIVERYALIAFDAEVDGIESEAMNLLGQAAAPEQYAERRARLTALYERQGWCEWPRPESYRTDDPHHPYAVLGRWRLALEEQGWLRYDDRLVTVSNAASALDGALDGGFPHGDEFADFAREIAACLAHLEAVDHDDRTPEQGRPCPTCVDLYGKGNAPRLRKRYAFHLGHKAGDRCPNQVKATEKAERRRGFCALDDLGRRIWEIVECETCDGGLDAWHCPDHPEHAWTDRDYRSRVGTDYRAHATHLSATELADRLGVRLSRVRKWCARTWDEDAREWIPPLLVSRRKVNGRKVYSVRDAMALVDGQVSA